MVRALAAGTDRDNPVGSDQFQPDFGRGPGARSFVSGAERNRRHSGLEARPSIAGAARSGFSGNRLPPACAGRSRGDGVAFAIAAGSAATVGKSARTIVFAGRVGAKTRYQRLYAPRLGGIAVGRRKPGERRALRTRHLTGPLFIFGLPG